LQRLEDPAANPFDPRISKLLQQAGGKRSSRVGDQRVVYQVDRSGRVVLIIAVLPRGKAYRRLN
jgi:mRNA-degrading endonuclease RelE of RelBE toxin-antitoxin system